MKRMMRKKRMKGGRKRRKRKSSLRQAEEPVQAAAGAAGAAAGRWKFSRLVAPAGSLTHTLPPKPFLSQPTNFLPPSLKAFTDEVSQQ